MSTNAHLLKRHCFSKESVSIIVLIVSAQFTILANWKPILLAYKTLPDIVWLQDAPTPTVLPLSLPGLSWNPYGKVVGTRASIALSYTTHNVSAGQSALSAPSVGEFCGSTCSIGLDMGSMTPDVFVNGLTGVGNSELTVQIPWATNAVTLSGLWGVSTIVLSESNGTSATAAGEKQLWLMTIDSVPMLKHIAASESASIDRVNSLGTLRFTPRLRSGANATLQCRFAGHSTISAGRLEFVLAEDVGCSDGPLIHATSVGVLGRVGGPTGHGVTPFLLSDRPVETCLQVGSGAVLCTSCSVQKCLAHFITG